MDDSAQVMLALSRVKTSNESYQTKSVQRAMDWILSMQCKNGGWASFDKDNDRMVFQHIPFADHNAMLDPATVDITGRVLECLATLRLLAERRAGAAGRGVHQARAGA